MSFNPWILTFYLIVTSNSQSWLLDVIHIIFHVIIIPFYLIIITFYLIIVTVYHAIVLFSILCHFLSNTFDSHLIMMTFFHNDTRMFFFSTSLVLSCLALSECTAHLPVSVMGLGPPADPPPCCHVAHEDSSHGDHTAAEGEVSGMSQTGGSWGEKKKQGF